MSDQGGGLTLDFDFDAEAELAALPQDEFSELDDLLPEAEAAPVAVERDPFALNPYQLRSFGEARICVFDSETDPFGEQVSLAAFTCGFKDCHTGDYFDFWGEDAIDQFFAFLKAEYTDKGIRCIIYVHNLGGFDLFFMLQHLDSGTYPTIIGGRVSSVKLGGQEFRDSYRIIPVALSVYKKDDFDYRKLRRSVRDKHREEILLYQRHDCENLADLVTEFIAQFGDRPTIGNTAISFLRSFHGFERMKEGADNLIRPFFHGGRCQGFEFGVLRGAFKVYDVTSMYPFVMKSYLHPVSAEVLRGRSITEKTAYIEWFGENENAVPVRAEDGSLDFTCKQGRFLTSAHEFHLAEKLGLIRPRSIIQTMSFRTWTTFEAFIDHFFEARKVAQENRDKLRDIFYKLIMNSAYGKFAQDPRRYEQYCITVGELPPEDEIASITNPNGWKPKTINGDTIVWSKDSPNRFNGFFNVATGASITGAARAVLLDGLSKSKRPVYCDTDSIICESLSGVDFDGSVLGGWKLEAVGEVFACAGKKLYALFTRNREAWVKATAKMGDEDRARMDTVSIDGETFYCIKKACKGSVLSGSQIFAVANGAEIRYVSDRPTFSLFTGKEEWEKPMERLIKRTG